MPVQSPLITSLGDTSDVVGARSGPDGPPTVVVPSRQREGGGPGLDGASRALGKKVLISSSFIDQKFKR